MKPILFTLLLFPLLSLAQNLPRFENDTLTTSGGYKIYKGQTVRLAKGTSEAGYFNFVKFHQNQAKNNTYTLENSSVLVKGIKAFKYTSPDNNSIRITGTLTYKDGKQEETDLLVNVERATEDFNGLPSELNVPEQFKRKTGQPVIKAEVKQPAAAVPQQQTAPDDIKKLLVADEIKKLFDLYKAGALTKAEYEMQKKKLLDRQ
jgi:hypothetical protein